MANEWWRGCVIYQIYPRSFCDTNADGIGDLGGIISKLEHVASLGVDAIWISPFFMSPMKDFGYDVSDYYQVDPMFGSIEDFQELVKHAKNLGLKVLIDQVWGHTSDQHRWFKESRMSLDNSKADWYVWQDPKADGTPPNNWLSYFGGPAWTWDARREQYYLHHFLKEQPSLNIWCDEVREEIKKITSYWLDLGVDGFRLDASHAHLYDKQFRDNPPRKEGDPPPSDVPASNPMARQRRLHSMCVPENLDWIQEIREFVNKWPDRCLLGEAGGDDSEKIAASYVQTGKRFHLAYSFGLVGSEMSRNDITGAIASVEDVIDDGWICWSTNNHDFKRVVSRVNSHYGDPDNIARFAMALGLSLRGSFCMYQGEELGLKQAEVAFDDLVDPYDIMLYPEHVGRDGCRTPMPWLAHAPHAGFSTTTGKTWLPVYDEHVSHAVDRQEKNEKSVLNDYRRFIEWRKSCDALRIGDIELIDSPDTIAAYLRTYEDEAVLCIFNANENEESWEVPKEYEEFSFIEKISHNALVNNGKIKFEPYGYAFFTRK